MSSSPALYAQSYKDAGTSALLRRCPRQIGEVEEYVRDHDSTVRRALADRAQVLGVEFGFDEESGGVSGLLAGWAAVASEFKPRGFRLTKLKEAWDRAVEHGFV